MKKLYSLLLFVAVIGISVSKAGNSCAIDQLNQALFNPDPNSVPCAEINVAYNQTLQFYIPVSKDITIAGQTVTVYIDSVVFNTVIGLPAGLNWNANPAGPLYMPGTNGCGLTFGTTTAAAGNYPISFDGLMYMHGSLFGFTLDTSLPIDQVIENEYGKKFSIDVIAQGAICGGTGVKDFNADLNAMLSVYPNPSNGVFEMKLNAGGRVNGEVVIVDVTGKKVYGQQLDVMGLHSSTIDLSNMPKGLYTLQLRTAEGFASKNISIE